MTVADTDSIGSTTEADLWGDGNKSESAEAEFDKAVEAERLRLDVRDAARRQQLEEAWKPPENQGNLAHQFDTVDTTIEYVVDEILPRKMIAQLNAQFKCGKTTLVTNLVQSLAEGSPFLDRFLVDPKFNGNVAHWNLEVSQETLLSWYEKQGIKPDALKRVYPLHIRGNLHLDFNNPVAMDWTTKWLKDNRIRVWVIDPLSKLFRDNENDNVEFNRWWLKLEHIAAEAKLELVLLIHHTGHSGQRSRGASSMQGNPDVLLNYRHAGNLGDIPPNNIRYLEGFGRGVDLRRGEEIDFEPETNRLFCTNSGTTRTEARAETLARSAAQAAWNALDPEDELNATKFREAVGWSRGGSASADQAKALEIAVANGWLRHRTKGRSKLYGVGSVDPDIIETKSQSELDSDVKSPVAEVHRKRRAALDELKATGMSDAEIEACLQERTKG